MDSLERFQVKNIVLQPEAAQFRINGEPPALVVTITTAAQLREALAKRDRHIVIDNPELERQFRWLEFWQQSTLPFIALLMALLIAFAIERGYKLDTSIRHDWKLERTEGKLTLTPMQK